MWGELAFSFLLNHRQVDWIVCCFFFFQFHQHNSIQHLPSWLFDSWYKWNLFIQVLEMQWKGSRIVYRLIVCVIFSGCASRHKLMGLTFRFLISPVSARSGYGHVGHIHSQIQTLVYRLCFSSLFSRRRESNLALHTLDKMASHYMFAITQGYW